MCQAVYQKDLFYPMGQALYQKKISTDLTSCVSKIFFHNRCDKLCIKRGDGVPFLLVSREAAARALSAALYLFFTCSSYFFYHLLLSIMIKTVINHQNYLWSSRSWLSVTVGLISTGASESQSKTDIGNQLPNLRSSSSLRILRILMILGTNFHIWDLPPLW